MLFNHKTLNLKRIRAKHFICNSFFYKNLCKDIVQRIQIIDIDRFENVLLIDPNFRCFLKNVKNDIDIKFGNIIGVEDDFWNLPDKKYNLIIMTFGLHWVEDIGNFLHYVKSFLSDKGIFLFKTIGNKSFSNLCRLFISLEEKYYLPHFLHVIPPINFDSMNYLIQKIGFGDIILDQEELKFEFKSAFSLMKYIKNLAESNILYLNGSYRINKDVYRELLMKEKNQIAFQDSIYMLTGLFSKFKNVLLVKRG